MKKKPLTVAELQKIIAKYRIPGGGLTATVQRFANAVPVAERTVWYWIGGRKIHPAMAERIKGMKPPRKEATCNRPE